MVCGTQANAGSCVGMVILQNQVGGDILNSKMEERERIPGKGWPTGVFPFLFLFPFPLPPPSLFHKGKVKYRSSLRKRRFSQRFSVFMIILKVFLRQKHTVGQNKACTVQELSSLFEIFAF